MERRVVTTCRMRNVCIAEETEVEPGALRRLAVMGTFAVLAMLVMYLFMAKQVTDTDVPRVRKFVVSVLARSLEPDADSSLRMRRLAPGLDAPRHYELVVTPLPKVAADLRAVDKLLTRGAGYVIEEVRDGRGAPSVTCVARLPRGSERRLTFDAKLRAMEEPVPSPAPPE